MSARYWRRGRQSRIRQRWREESTGAVVVYCSTAPVITGACLDLVTVRLENGAAQDRPHVVDQLPVARAEMVHQRG